MHQPTSYPINFTVEYPDQPLNRVTTAVRPFLAIPVVLLLVILQNSEFDQSWDAIALSASGALTGAGVLVFPVVLMLVARQKYPRWWFEWNQELLRFVNRVVAYLALMTDVYPSTDEQQSVRLTFPYPAEKSLSRGLPLVKWLLATPHYFVLALLLLGLPFVLLGAWIAILITGNYPRSLFGYVEGTLRWINRVTGYAYTLVTDEYPPFRLAP